MKNLLIYVFLVLLVYSFSACTDKVVRNVYHPSAVFTHTITPNFTQTYAANMTETKIAVGTDTVTKTITPTFTVTLTSSVTSTYSFTPTNSATKTITETHTNSPTVTHTVTITATPTITQTRTYTCSSTNTFTRTCTPTITITLTSTPTPPPKTIGGATNDTGNSVRQTTDLGYIITGGSASIGPGCYLLKTDSFGNVSWEKTFSDYNPGESVWQTSDSGYIISGYVSTADQDMYMIKTDSIGDCVWARTYPFVGPDQAKFAIQTNDGGYAVIGSSGTGTYQIRLIKTDSSGNSLWSKTYGSGCICWDMAGTFRQTSDNGYIITGNYGATDDVVLIKTDSSGNQQWLKTFGGTGTDHGNYVIQTSDNGYMIAGYTNSFGNGGSDFYAIKADSAGNCVWTRTFGGSGSDGAESVVQTSDLGYVIAGYTTSFGATSGDIYIVKADSAGNCVWSRTYGGTNFETGNSIDKTNGNGLIVVGETNSYGAGASDIYLIKLFSDGNREW